VVVQGKKTLNKPWDFSLIIPHNFYNDLHCSPCFFGILIFLFVILVKSIELGPDPTRAYFWPAVNKRPTHLWPGYLLNGPKRFFWPEGLKIFNFDLFTGNFPNPNTNHRWLPRPVSTRATKNWPDLTQVKKFSPVTITRNQSLKLHINLAGNCSWIFLTIWSQKLPLVLATTPSQVP